MFAETILYKRIIIYKIIFYAAGMFAETILHKRVIIYKITLYRIVLGYLD